MAVLSFNPNTHVVRVLVRSAVDNGLSRVKPKTIKLLFTAFPLH